MFDRNKDDRSAKAAPQPAASPGPSPVNAAPSPVSAPAPSTGARSGNMATIGATIRIKGDVSGDENLLIEGTVEGTVTLAANELIIGQSGKVTADVTAKTIRVQGTVQGDITGNEYVLISATSNIKGNVVTPRMTLEDGARFKGSIDIDPDRKSSGGSSYSNTAKIGSGKDDKPGSVLSGEIV